MLITFLLSIFPCSSSPQKYLVQKQLCLLEVLVSQAPGTVPSCNHSSVTAVPSCPFDVAFAF